MVLANRRLEEHLKFDPWQRGAFIESVLPDDTRLDDYRSSVQKELGGFRTGRYSADTLENNGLRLSRSAVSDWPGLSITKEILPAGKGSFSVNYALKPHSPPYREGFRCGLVRGRVNPLLPGERGLPAFIVSPETALSEDIGLRLWGA